MIAHPMKRLFLKLCSLVMIMSVALSVISCGKTKGNKRDATIISEDSPWFTSNIIDCESGADPDKNIEYLNYSLAGADDKYYVVFARGRYAMPPEDEIDHDKLMEFFPQIDKNKHMYSSFIIGYPKKTFKRTVPHKEINVKYM